VGVYGDYFFNNGDTSELCYFQLFRIRKLFSSHNAEWPRDLFLDNLAANFRREWRSLRKQSGQLLFLYGAVKYLRFKSSTRTAHYATEIIARNGVRRSSSGCAGRSWCNPSIMKINRIACLITVSAWAPRNQRRPRMRGSLIQGLPPPLLGGAEVRYIGSAWRDAGSENRKRIDIVLTWRWVEQTRRRPACYSGRTTRHNDWCSDADNATNTEQLLLSSDTIALGQFHPVFTRHSCTGRYCWGAY